MPLSNKFLSLNEAYPHLIDCVLSKGSKAAPRGASTIEAIGVSFTIENPRARLLTSKRRNWSLALAIGELCWHLRGDRDVASLAYYAPAWHDVTDDGRTVRGSCYGHKLLAELQNNNKSAWDNIISLLKKDNHTRRASFSFIDDSSDFIDSKDVSCINCIQFLIRNNSLHAFVSMRSNDLYLGLPYDVFFFSFLQEILSHKLGVSLGTYNHFATSLHIYERDLYKSQSIVEEGFSAHSTMAELACIDQMQRFLQLECEIRTGRFHQTLEYGFDKYWMAMIRPLLDFQKKKLRLYLDRKA